MSDQPQAVDDGRRWWKPHWWYRPADERNESQWGFSWLFLHVWTHFVPHFTLSVELARTARVQVMVLYLIVCVEVPLMSPDFYFGKLSRKRATKGGTP